MAMYDFASRTAELTNKYAQDRAAQEYGRFLAQQRFQRQRSDLDYGFQRQFPKVTAGLARRFGGNVRSGLIGQTVGRTVGDYNTNVSDLNTQQAAYEGQYASQQALQEAGYRAALLQLMEQMQAERAGQNPFTTYTGVYGG